MTIGLIHFPGDHDLSTKNFPILKQVYSETDGHFILS